MNDFLEHKFFSNIFDNLYILKIDLLTFISILLLGLHIHGESKKRDSVLKTYFLTLF